MLCAFLTNHPKVLHLDHLPSKGHAGDHSLTLGNGSWSHNHSVKLTTLCYVLCCQAMKCGRHYTCFLLRIFSTHNAFIRTSLSETEKHLGLNA